MQPRPAAAPLRPPLRPRPPVMLPDAPTAPVRRPGNPALEINNIHGPRGYDCGRSEWGIQWILARKSEAGGHVVQHVVTSYAIQDATGHDVTVRIMGQAKSDFWEAWPFNPGQKVTTFAESGDVEDDNYTTMGMTFGKTMGVIVITGDAKFYEGLTELPGGFRKNNPATFAGPLASTTTDPGLREGSASVAHNLTVMWDCTEPETGFNHDTDIVSHAPRV